MNEAGFLDKLTFMGGTCLRMCYNSERLSEDLDFSSSFDFSKESLVDFGTSDLFLYAESLEEILCDKLIAFANRPNRMKNRDLWDIFWLSRKNISKNQVLLEQKLSDGKIPLSEYDEKFSFRIAEIKTGQDSFLKEMRRFLFAGSFTKNFTSPMWWEYLIQLLTELK